MADFPGAPMVKAGPGKVLTSLMVSIDWRAWIYNVRVSRSLNHALEKLARRGAQN